MCIRNLRSVFDPMRRPWIDPKGALSENIKHTIEKCPTGALTFAWNDQERNRIETSPKFHQSDNGRQEVPVALDPARSKAEICFTPDGPMMMRGEFSVTAEGFGDFLEQARDASTLAFCRCGRSRGKPFCDGLHAE